VDTLRDFVGTWHVLIRKAQTPPWRIVLLERHGALEPEGGGFRRTLLLDPRGQTPEAVGKAIEEALKGAVQGVRRDELPVAALPDRRFDDPGAGRYAPGP
jgi:hypothetical protein